MEQAIAVHGLEVAGGGAGGSSLWMRAPENVDAADLVTLLAEDGVLIESGTPFFPEENGPKNYYRLAYSSIASNRIPEGISLIARAIDTLKSAA